MQETQSGRQSAHATARNEYFHEAPHVKFEGRNTVEVAKVSRFNKGLRTLNK